MNVTWVTTFEQKMWEASGRHLAESFLDRRVPGRLVCCHEGGPAVAAAVGRLACARLEAVPLDGDEFLRQWLAKNHDVVPQSLGGGHPGCACRGGPFEPKDKRHRMPCAGAWFCKNASRWFRKVAALRLVGERLHDRRQAGDRGGGDDVVVWVDADCRFHKAPTTLQVASWFEGGSAVFYLQSRRPVLEAGVVGYWLARGADKILGWMIDCYFSGRYRGMLRWDDSYVLQKALAKNPDVKRVDLAYRVGKHAAVVEHSVLKDFLRHDKGKHGRGLGIMT
jgi:hypothetical protein